MPAGSSTTSSPRTGEIRTTRSARAHRRRDRAAAAAGRGATRSRSSIATCVPRARPRARDAASPADGDLDARLATLEALRREMLGARTPPTRSSPRRRPHARRVLEIRRAHGRHDALGRGARGARVEATLRRRSRPTCRPRRARARRRAASRRPREDEDQIRSERRRPRRDQALRERLAGTEVAARLADLDARRAAWRACASGDLRRERARIAADPTLDAAAKADAHRRACSTGSPRRAKAPRSPSSRARPRGARRRRGGKRAWRSPQSPIGGGGTQRAAPFSRARFFCGRRGVASACRLLRGDRNSGRHHGRASHGSPVAPSSRTGS